MSKTAPKFELYEQVELEGVAGKWWTERYILTRVFDQGMWWYGITHPYQGNNGITQLSAVVEFPEYCLRHPENSEKLKVITLRRRAAWEHVNESRLG